MPNNEDELKEIIIQLLPYAQAEMNLMKSNRDDITEVSRLIYRAKQAAY